MVEEKDFSRQRATDKASIPEVALPLHLFRPMSRSWFPAAVLLTGLILTLLAAYYAFRTIQLRAGRTFETDALRARSTIRGRFEIYDELLRATAGFTEVEREVTWQRFRDYVQLLHIAQNYPSVQGLGFASRVSAPDKDEFIAAMHQQGYDHFRIWPESEHADFYPVTFLEPQNERNKQIIGFDMSSDPARREAMERARDTADAAASGKVTLVLNKEVSNQPLILICFPVYRGGVVPESVADRRAKLEGYAFAPFRTGDLFTTIFAQENLDLQIEIYDGTNIDDDALLFRSGPRIPGTFPFRRALEQTSTLDIDGRTWTVHFVSQPQMEGEWILLSVLLGGGILSLMMFYLTRAEARARRVAERAALQLKASEVALRESEERLRLYATELERRVAERTANLAQSIQSLEGVLYHVAHDLRAPLRGMASFTNILLEEYGPKLDDVGRDYTLRISSAAQRMDRLVQDLLAYGRLTHTAVPISKISLETEIKTALDQFSGEIETRHAAIEVCSPLPPVKANASILNQVISSLLSNALKFVTPEANPHLRIFAEETTSRIDGPDTKAAGAPSLDRRLGALDGKFVRLWFEDNGIGIAPQYHERIFRMFERLHGVHSYAGTGIGLAIVRKGVERMGGRVGVESSAGAGSRFWVELPAA